MPSIAREIRYAKHQILDLDEASIVVLKISRLKSLLLRVICERSDMDRERTLVIIIVSVTTIP